MAQLVAQAFELKLTALQNATMYLLGRPLIANNLDISVLAELPKEETLLAFKATQVWPFSLPPNQWEMEVKAWNAMILTQLQKLSSDVAVGASVSGSRFDAIPLLPAGPAERAMCHSQKMIAPAGFSNVSVFGLGFTIGICLSIALVNVFLKRTLHRLAQIRGTDAFSLEQWDEDDMLHMQRELLETQGIKDWSTKTVRTSISGGGAALVPAVMPPSSQWSFTEASPLYTDGKPTTEAAVMVHKVSSADEVMNTTRIEGTRLLHNGP